MAQAYYQSAVQEPFRGLPGQQGLRPRQDSVSEWMPRRETWNLAAGCCGDQRQMIRQALLGLRAPQTMPKQPGPLRTSPCPGLDCWCAQAWRDQTAPKRHCIGHLGETEAVCHVHWSHPSRTAQVTLRWKGEVRFTVWLSSSHPPLALHPH